MQKQQAVFEKITPAGVSRQPFNTNPQKHDTMAQKRRGLFLLGINPFFIKFILLIGIVMAAQWACDGYKPKKKEEPGKKEAEPYKKYNYLVNSYEPTAKSDYCWVYNYKSSRAEELPMTGGESGYGGFKFEEEGAYITFNIGGGYETLTFTMGHARQWSDNTGIVTVRADGKKILDEKVRDYEPPRQYSLNVKGVNELTFAITSNYIKVVVADAILWREGEKPVDVRPKHEPITTPIELVKDLRPYHKSTWMKEINKEEGDSIKINGQTFNYGLIGNMEMALIGTNEGKAYFNLRKQFKKLTFTTGCRDDLKGQGGSGWVTVKADGKTLEEIEIKEGDIAKQVILDITGCESLSFHTEQINGESFAGITQIMVYPDEKDVPQELSDNRLLPPCPRLKELPNACKLISSIPPYRLVGSVDKQLYDNSSEHLTFSMGGYKFSEGIILYQKAWLLNDNLSASATFDLGNEFDYVGFTTGYVGKSWNMNDDLLMVYADDELVYSTPLIATYPNKQHIVPIKKCRSLRFANKGCGRMDVAAFGIGDIVVYRGEPVENNLFEREKPQCPHTAELIDLGLPYIHYVSIMENHKDEILHDGSTKKRYFELNGERIYKGFMLQTSTHFSLDFGVLGDKGQDAAAGSILGAAALGASFVASGVAVGGVAIGTTVAPLGAFLMLAAGGEAVENSLAAFNTYKEYNSVTFKVGCLPQAGVKSEEPERLMIGADHNVMANIALYENMEPMEFTVPIDGCEQLIFWLANSGGNSAKYLIYDIVVTKDKLPLNIPEAARMPLPEVSAE